MLVLRRYLIKTITLATLCTILIVGGVMAILSLLNEARTVGQGGYNFYQALVYVASALPNDLYQFFPILIVLGSVVGTASLYCGRELLVMRIMGLSQRYLLGSILGAVTLLVIVGSIIGEVFAPKLQALANIQQHNALHGHASMISATGIWLHQGSDFIHIDQLLNQNRIEGITVYQLGAARQLSSVITAKRAHLSHHQWMLYDCSQTMFSLRQIKQFKLAQMVLKQKLNITQLMLALDTPETMSLKQLLAYSHYLTKNALQAKVYEYAYWKRLFQPLLSCLLPSIIVPFILCAVTTQQFAWRAVLGIIFSCFIYFVIAVFAQLCFVYQWSVLIAAGCPNVLLLLLGGYVVVRHGENNRVESS